jgi:hypothetical protein
MYENLLFIDKCPFVYSLFFVYLWSCFVNQAIFSNQFVQNNHMHIHLRYKIAHAHSESLFSYRQRGTPTHALVNDTVHWFTCKYFVRSTIINKKKEKKEVSVLFIMNRIYVYFVMPRRQLIHNI